MVACSFCEITLTTPKPKPNGYPEKEKTIGDKIRKARMDRKLTQGELAKMLGVEVTTLRLWELNKCSPSTPSLQKIYSALLQLNAGDLNF